MRTGNVKVTLSLLGPALRGLILQGGRAGQTDMQADHRVRFDWTYERGRDELARLYEAAKRSQWNATTDIDWSVDVDPYDPRHELFPEHELPIAEFPGYLRLNTRERAERRWGLTSWMLSQFLHGEQGALFAACQVTEAIEWMDGKLYGSTQVVDEGRHVEVFFRYLHEKLGKVYTVNDNLFTLIDALMTDSRWDIKFLGMQIMIEGLALGAFGILRQTTREPLLRHLLRYVITDEARHVHYGVIALRDYYHQLPERDRREREDWAFEVATLMRNRFLAHEFYDEYFGQSLSRREWDQMVLRSPYMDRFRRMMFKRLIPNLKRINLLSDRIRPHYQALGLLDFENGRAAPDLSADELIAETDRQLH
ncbi:MAG: ferritin-like domain-containing protein [Myxococcales bacterium]|nr:ferritin-like domain-containing protein [Myxococcales bacterium]MCB9704273.1 ferritin-like domain-containing protein [Myxococcales bacterium]